MARPKGQLTFRQFLQKKDYNLYRHFRNDKIFSIHDILKCVDEWEEEKKKELEKRNP